MRNLPLGNNGENFVFGAIRLALTDIHCKEGAKDIESSVLTGTTHVLVGSGITPPHYNLPSYL